MKIDFKEIGWEVEPNFNGGEGFFTRQKYEDDNSKIVLGTLKKGSSIGLHTHEGEFEVIYILQGQGKMICNCEEEILNPGDVSYCPNDNSHTLMNENEDELKFFSVIAKLK